MTTLNARANQAYHEWAEQMDGWPADSEKAVFEEGYETGYKAAQADVAKRFREDAIDEAVDGKLNLTAVIRMATEAGGAS